MKWYPSMETCSYIVMFLLAFLIPCSSNYTATGIVSLGTHAPSKIHCIREDREALLQFKQGIKVFEDGINVVDECGLLTSWAGQECCQWYGVGCSKRSSHVISLNLTGCYLGGNVSSSLVKLKHLKHLNLSFNNFRYQPIPSFIGSLHSLKYLDLSHNHFQGEIPHQLANLSSLKYLDLSYNNFQGEIPHQLANLSSLTYLDLHSYISLSSLYVKNLGWLSHLTLLSDINLGSVNLSLATDWLELVSGLPFLRSLQLGGCNLAPIVPRPLSYRNSSTTLRVLSLPLNRFKDFSILQWVSNLTGISNSLEYLDLSGNLIAGPIPHAFGNLYSLSYLDLSYNSLEGHIPSFLGNLHSLSHLGLVSNGLEGLVPGSIFELKLLQYIDLSCNYLQGIQFSNSQGTNLCSLQTLDVRNNSMINDLSSIIQTVSGCSNSSLRYLDVSQNRIWGSIPDTIGSLSSLEILGLHNNQLNGTISPCLGQLSRLSDLDLSSNSLRGTLSNHHLSNLSSIISLDLSDNKELMVNIGANWVPPFQLHTISMRSCKLGPYFPKWLLNQTELMKIDISNTGISDSIPNSLWNSFSLNLLNMSNNEIHGVLPNQLEATVNLHYHIDLSSNRIKGAIPSFLGNATTLFLNDNRFSGSLIPFCPKSSYAYVEILDLSNNFLSGELPDCWQSFSALSSLRLDNNNFTGKLPPSLGALNGLLVLSMRNNRFNGELQIPLENWTSLAVLDLGYNSFTGHIPLGIGSFLNASRILSLRSNNISGKLPLSLCGLSELQILDLSFNQISGILPECICHLQGMTNSKDKFYTSIYYPGSATHGDDRFYTISEMIMWKRKEQSFKNSLGMVKYMAISDNRLQGHIPSGISNLTGLVSLDLARNNFTGSIPSNISELESLEFLDLSRNHFSGEIPSSLANLNFLGTLNVSYNNLSGIIPTSTQLQSQDPSAYVGNPGLCGPPLLECFRGPPPMPPKGVDIAREDDDDDSSHIFPGLYISVVLGFIVGFWGVCGTLVIRMTWREALFRFVEDMNDRFHVMVAVTIHRVWRRPRG